jgi:hypothetical protein
MQNRDWLTRQLSIILDAIREEIEEDDSVFADPTSGLWIQDFAKLMDWTATGDYSKLPEHLVPIACNIEGRPIPVKPDSNWAYNTDNPDLVGQKIELPVTQDNKIGYISPMPMGAGEKALPMISGKNAAH